jgi:predicted naringenin-chalcone synthase
VSPAPRILSVGTANPPTRYTQSEFIDLLGIRGSRVARLFQTSHIRYRHLILPEPGPDGRLRQETSEQLLAKHREAAIELGSEAIRSALAPISATACSVDYLACATTTGFLCPGLTARYSKDLGMREDVQRVDIVGMGCNAGLNSLQAVANFCAANPGRLGVLVCAEICSAAYVFTETVRTAVVNSLFGDGVAAVTLRADDSLGTEDGPAILGFESEIIVDAIESMHTDLEDGKFSFFLDIDVPYVIGRHVELPVDRLLSRFGLRRRDIRQWIVHSGGMKVIDAVKYNLGLTDHDVRHTKTVLRDYGNLSSASFLFAYQRLMKEETADPGDLGVMITMGPGASIETCLIRY